MTKTRFRHIFDPELFGRLQWFGRLRWLAVSGLAVGALIGSRLGLQSVWPSLFVVASVVAVYNLFFHWLLRGYRRQPGDRSRIDLRVVAICETMMDLTALMVTVHYTGGLQSPLLPFFAFHMAIGTIMSLIRPPLIPTNSEIPFSQMMSDASPMPVNATAQ